MRQLNLSAIYHMPWLEYRHATPEGNVVIRVRTARGDFDRVVLKTANQYNLSDPFGAGSQYEMTVQFRNEQFDYYEAVFSVRDPRLKYLFIFYADGGRVYKLDGAGMRIGEHSFDDISESFAFAYAYPPEPMPAWARGCVGYQVFPDRFRREGAPEAGLEPWDSMRVQSEYRFGGNLSGIRAALPYLKDLGVQMLYTTPIFVSDSAHRYNTFDYFTIDPLLGTLAEFKALCDEAHAQGIRIILDGVFNHCGTGFAPFADAQEKGEASAYRDWFFFDDLEPFGYRAFGHWPVHAQAEPAKRSLRGILFTGGHILADGMPCRRLAAGREPRGIPRLLARFSPRNEARKPRMPDYRRMLGRQPGMDFHGRPVRRDDALPVQPQPVETVCNRAD